MLGRSFFRTEMSLGAGVLTKFRIRLLQLEQNSVFQKSRLCECTVKVLCRNAVFFQKHFVQPPAFEGYFATCQKHAGPAQARHAPACQGSQPERVR